MKIQITNKASTIFCPLLAATLVLDWASWGCQNTQAAACPCGILCTKLPAPHSIVTQPTCPVYCVPCASIFFLTLPVL